MNIATYNINNISSPEKLQIILNFFLNQKLDIVCLQEVVFPSCTVFTNHYQMYTNLGPRKHGTAILVRHGLSASNILLEPEGRLIAMEVKGFAFVCIYAPSGDQNKSYRDSFLRQTIPAYVAQYKAPAIILGDFNAIDEIDDRKSNKATPPKTRLSLLEPLRDLVKALSLTDVWKDIRKNEPCWTYNCATCQARLDRIYCQHHVKFSDIHLHDLPLGDHRPIVGYINSTVPRPVMRKKSMDLWKLNTSILDEEEYVELVHAFIEEMSQHPSRIENVDHWWEYTFKPGLRRLSINYCRKRICDQRVKRKLLQHQLNETVNNANFNHARYMELKREFLAWEREALRGFAIRSRVQTSIEEEPSTFHMNKSTSNFQKSLITQLKTDDNRKVTQPGEINQVIIEHFSKIFQNQPLPNTQLAGKFLDGIRGALNRTKSNKNDPGVTVVAQSVSTQATNRGVLGSIPVTDSYLVAPFTVGEINNALRATKKNKAPGTDGIPFEFYLKFWDVIGAHFLDMMNSILDKKKLQSSQGRAAIRLVPKIPTPSKITDYRPISLLNTDYKLIASVLAFRLRKSLPNSLGSHQKGGVPGRYIFDSLSLIRDVIDNTGRKSKEVSSLKPAAIIAYDLEKAYDLVNRDVLWEVMTAMGYPTLFVDWLKTLYSITELCPLNGNDIVGTVDNAQSVRQGCPLSVHLFALYIEPLLVCLAKGIDGIEHYGKRVKVRAYVDDLVVFVSSVKDIRHACEIILEFCAWTNARINKGKTKLLDLGTWALNVKNSSVVAQSSKAPSGVSKVIGSIPSRSKLNPDITKRTWPYDWIAQVDELKILGIIFTPEIKTTTKINWQRQFNIVQNILISNTHRHFTFYGRVLFIKQHVLSQLIHIAHVLPCNKTQALLLQQKCNKFLWCQRREHPPLNVLIRPRLQGGLGATLLFQFFLSLFTRQIFKSLIHPEAIERTASVYWLGSHLKKFLPQIIQPRFDPPHSSHPYFTTSLPTIMDLLKAGIFTSSSASTHRATYNHLIANIGQPGRTEISKPDLDWASIWRWVAKIKGLNAELIWDFNQNQLPTNMRLKALKLSDNDLCPLCEKDQETDDHLMLMCQEKFNLNIWLRVQLTKLGCLKPLQSAIHGDVGTLIHKKKALALIQSYITTVWTARSKNATPAINEVQSLWSKLLHSNNSPQMSLSKP
jgi:exonuclease III